MKEIVKTEKGEKVFLDNVFDEKKTLGDFYEFERCGRKVLGVLEDEKAQGKKIAEPYEFKFIVGYEDVTAESASQGGPSDYGFINQEGAEVSQSKSNTQPTEITVKSLDELFEVMQEYQIARQELPGEARLSSNEINEDEKTRTYSFHLKEVVIAGHEIAPNKVTALLLAMHLQEKEPEIGQSQEIKEKIKEICEDNKQVLEGWINDSGLQGPGSKALRFDPKTLSLNIGYSCDASYPFGEVTSEYVLDLKNEGEDLREDPVEIIENLTEAMVCEQVEERFAKEEREQQVKEEQKISEKASEKQGVSR